MASFSKEVQKSNLGDYKQGSAIVELRTSRFKAKFKMSASVMAACFSCLASAAGTLSVKRPKRAKMHTACDINFAASVPEHLKSLQTYPATGALLRRKHEHDKQKPTSYCHLHLSLT